jgi:hypothetical protein
MSRLELLENAKARLEMGKKEAEAQEEKFRKEIRKVEAYRLQQAVEERYLRAFPRGEVFFKGGCAGWS